MRKSTLLLLPLAMVGSAASAQSTGTVYVEGTVAGRCLFTVPSKTISLGEMALPGSDTNAGRLDTSKVDNRNETLVGWCNNAAAGMTVEAFPLVNTAPAATGFTNHVDYTATATANSASASDTTLDAGAGTSQGVGMFAGDVVVTLSNSSAPNNGLLVAGDYNGRVEVTLTPVFTPPI